MSDQPSLRRIDRPAGLSADACAPPPASIDIETTNDIPGDSKVMPQPRACAALELGLRITRRNYHVFLAGPPGTGRRLLTKQILAEIISDRPTPPDRLYLHSFEDEYTPVVVSQPAGQGQRLRDALAGLLTSLKEDIPDALESHEHQNKMQSLAGNLQRARADATLQLRRDALALGFEVEFTEDGQLQTKVLENGEVLDDRALLEMADDARLELEGRRKGLDPLIGDFARAHHRAENDAHDEMSALRRSKVEEVTALIFGELREQFEDGDGVLETYFAGLSEFVVENLEVFLEDDDDEPTGRDPFVPFHAALVVDNCKTSGAPVINETQPSYYRLFGKIERRMEHGGFLTDHTMLHAGSLAEANGGYLILHAQDVFSFPNVWSHLKLCLRNKEVAITDMGESVGMMPASGLKPDPLPLDVKVILVGSNSDYHALYDIDPDFRELFRVKAEFDDVIDRTAANIPGYVAYIAGSVRHNQVRAMTAAGVQAMLEHSSRAAGSQRKLTLRANVIGNLLVEADHFANRDDAEFIDDDHVRRAVAANQDRGGLLADKLLEGLTDGSLRVEASGAQVGVVNGVAVYRSGEHGFGHPVRVTARCFAGRAGVINIEHEADLSGQIHHKSIHLVAGFLGGRFARDEALAFTASVAFEQNYGMIEGDSAASTVLYAIVSALADVPIDQSVAVTGSISQLGEIQAVGGVDEKVEGFYRFCKVRGLSGRQGVILPECNARDLVLDQEVRDAIAAGDFHLWPIDNISQGLEILTGVAAGELDEEGNAPPDTIMGRAARRLEELRARAVRLAGNGAH